MANTPPRFDPNGPRKLISSYRSGMVIIQNGDVFEENGLYVGPAPEQVAGLTVDQIRSHAKDGRPTALGVFKLPEVTGPRRGRPRKIRLRDLPNGIRLS